MRLMLKTIKILVIVLVAVLVVAVGGALAMRFYRQHAAAGEFTIEKPAGIRESGYVRIGGIDQWVQIRGRHRDNPVLLCLHGGPGATWLPVTRLFRGWEQEFTVVLWDQRGAGKTLKVSGPAIASTMTIARMVEDGVELAEHLRMRLGKEKIILLGHSFGSVVGIRMALARPDLFHAFVGTGQVGDLPRSLTLEYARLQEQATAAHDGKTLAALAQIGPPPFKNLQQVATYFEQAAKYQPAADQAAIVLMKQSLLAPPPDFSLADEFNRFRGFASVPPWGLYDELLNTRLRDSGIDLKIPVIVIQGGKDTVTPLAHAEDYVGQLDAPGKALTVIPDAGHYAVWTHADAFLNELRQRVRPLAR